MGLNETILTFLSRTRDDPRVGPSHISLFIVLVMRGGSGGIVFFDRPLRTAICGDAKISVRTFHRCVHELQASGYLKYNPSYDARKKNKLILYD
jgi:hypothetical protein